MTRPRKNKGNAEKIDNYTNVLVIELNERITEYRKEIEELKEQVEFYKQFV